MTDTEAHPLLIAAARCRRNTGFSGDHGGYFLRWVALGCSCGDSAGLPVGILWAFGLKQRVSRWFGMGAGAILLGAATLKLEASAYLSVIVFIAFLVLFRCDQTASNGE